MIASQTTLGQVNLIRFVDSDVTSECSTFSDCMPMLNLTWLWWPGDDHVLENPLHPSSLGMFGSHHRYPYDNSSDITPPWLDFHALTLCSANGSIQSTCDYGSSREMDRRPPKYIRDWYLSAKDLWWDSPFIWCRNISSTDCNLQSFYKLLINRLYF